MKLSIAIHKVTHMKRKKNCKCPFSLVGSILINATQGKDPGNTADLYKT